MDLKKNSCVFENVFQATILLITGILMHANLSRARSIALKNAVITDFNLTMKYSKIESSS